MYLNYVTDNTDPGAHADAEPRARIRQHQEVLQRHHRQQHGAYQRTQGLSICLSELFLSQHTHSRNRERKASSGIKKYYNDITANNMALVNALNVCLSVTPLSHLSVGLSHTHTSPRSFTLVNLSFVIYGLYDEMN